MVFYLFIYKGIIESDSSLIHPDPKNPIRIFKDKIYLESIIVKQLHDYSMNDNDFIHYGEASYISLADHFKLISKYLLYLI